MDERSKVALATVLGATIGGVFGCLYLTERGRRTRDQMEPLLDRSHDGDSSAAWHGREASRGGAGKPPRGRGPHGRGPTALAVVE